MWLLWVLVAALFIGLEVLSGAFFAIFLGFGCLGAAVIAVLGLDPWIQIVVFAGVSVLGTVVLRPAMVRRFQRNSEPITPPGAAGLVGQQAVTVDEVGDEHHSGHAMLGGEKWLAFTDRAGTIAPNTPVTVTEVRGTTLVVRSVTTPAPKPAQ